MPQAQNNRHTKKQTSNAERLSYGYARVPLLLVVLVLFGLIGIAALNRQHLYDWWALRNYQAPAAVAQLATQATMTNYARQVFYVNHPAVDDKAAFAPVCPNGTEQTVVLGCYHSDQSGIFVLQVSDPRLNGVEQVTVAHETLHAIYDRLSSAKRQQVDGWLMDYYQHGLQDSTIKDQIASYQKTEPNDLVNEMHSLFGTEVGNLPTALENYYRQYFTDRAAIVADYNNYQTEFTSRQQTITADDRQLASLKTRIDADNTDLKTKQASLATQQQNLLNEQRSGNLAAYNADVPGFNAQIDQYNVEVNGVKSLVVQYNQLVASRNSLALEEQQLANDLTSSATTLTK